MSLHRSYDDAKADHDWSGGGPANPEAHTRKLWWDAFTFAERQGFADEWLASQRRFACFSAFVTEAERKMAAKRSHAA